MKKLSEAKIHIIGIGGTGMAPIATVLHESGASVSGSDRAESPFTQNLRACGIKVSVPQTADNITDPDYVFYSSAIHDDNPELAEARRRGIPSLKRREFLGLMLNDRKTVAIAGSHGKSTTTSMGSWVFTKLGLQPGYIIGSNMKDLGSNAAAGASDWFIIEADEYDNMFLGLSPYVAGLTRVEYDHPDCFPSMSLYLEAFGKFLANVHPGGMIFLNGDDPVQNEIDLPKGHTIYRYGTEPDSDFRAEDLNIETNGCFSFTFCYEDQHVPVELSIPGKHNVSNALLILGICAANGLDVRAAAEALKEFHGIGRRFEIVQEWNGITLVDDYGHHPTEIRATLSAARDFFPGRRILAIWQPHTFSRTKALLSEFSVCFDNADELIITDIYAARETQTDFGIEDVLHSVKHPSVHFEKTIADTASFLTKELKSGDVVVTLSAGDANQAAPLALEMMKNA